MESDSIRIRDSDFISVGRSLLSFFLSFFSRIETSIETIDA